MEKDAVLHKTTMNELVAILLKQHGIHQGKYTIAVEFKVGIGQVKFSDGSGNSPQIPSASIGVSQVGLIQDDANGVDAAEVNPPRKQRKKSPQAE